MWKTAAQSDATFWDVTTPSKIHGAMASGRMDEQDDYGGEAVQKITVVLNS